MATKTLTITVPDTRKEKGLAILAKLIAIALYAGNNIISKSLTTQGPHNLSVEAMLFYQYIFAAMLLIPYAKISDTTWSAPKNTSHHLGRIICCCCGLIFLHDAFKHMPITQAVGFNIFSPIITLIGSFWLLQERITWEKIVLLGLSMVAYLCLLQPTSPSSSHLNTWHMLKPSLAILCFQANTFFTKWLTQAGESAFYLTASILLCIPLSLLPIMCTTMQTYPNSVQMTMLAWMGVNDFLAILALNYAIAKADVSFLLPLGFSKYTLIAALGYWAFQETLTPTQILGLFLGLLCVWLLKKKV